MERHSRKSVAGLLITALLCVLPLAGTGGARLAEAAHNDKSGKQIVMTLDEMFGEMERPPALFDHDKHVEKLKNQGCRVCHEPNEDGKVSYVFVSLEEDADRRDAIDANHEKCMACHGGKDEGSEKTEPMVCAECHIEEADYKAYKWYRATFGHENHIDLMEKGCDTCHHKYDEITGESIYQKGDEAACGLCHKNKDEDNRIALRKAGHTKCIGCHEERFPELRKKVDPYDCEGCHKPEAKPAEIDMVKLTARSYDKRPEKLLLSYPGSIMPAVPFDHKQHAPGESCAKTCHHFHARTLARFDTRFAKTGDACRQCHLLTGAKIMSAGVEADKVYHDAESPYSCRGCHIIQNKNVQKEEDKAPDTCKGCHTGEITMAEAVAKEPIPFDLEAQPKGPETYLIATLSKKRLPVNFPHSRHSTMVDNCNACHHYSPENEIPTCYACHGASVDFTKKAKPELVGAYHRMCIGCHRSMGAGPITCNKCHEEVEAIHALDKKM